MKIAILLARGVEGCGVTTYAEEFSSYLKSKGLLCDVYASTDKKWGRSKMRKNDFILFGNTEVKEIARKLNTYDYVFYQSLPSKGHSEEYKKLFDDYLLTIDNPVKISIQNDHKPQSISRNHDIWGITRKMDAAYTYSLGSAFAKKAASEGIDTPIHKINNGFDFNSYYKHWIPTSEQIKRITYFGRFATWKDPARLIRLMPYLTDYIKEANGIEKSIGAKCNFFADKDMKDHPFLKIKSVYVEEEQEKESIYVYHNYERELGLKNLAKSMFGCNFFNLSPEAYGDIMEYTMCETIAVGSIGVFNQHWANNCYTGGKLFNDIKGFAIFSDNDDLKATADKMDMLLDNKLRDKFRINAFEVAYNHCNSNKIFGEILELTQTINKKQYENIF